MLWGKAGVLIENLQMLMHRTLFQMMLMDLLLQWAYSVFDGSCSCAQVIPRAALVLSLKTLTGSEKFMTLLQSPCLSGFARISLLVFFMLDYL